MLCCDSPAILVPRRKIPPKKNVPHLHTEKFRTIVMMNMKLEKIPRNCESTVTCIQQ